MWTQCQVGHPRFAVSAGVEDAAVRLRRDGVNTPSWHLDCAHWWDVRRDSASSKVHKNHREKVVWPLLTAGERASVRSQSGPLASVPFTSFPVCRVTRVDSQPFRVLLLRRLRLPLPLSVHSCSCGRQLDVLGHHRAACGRAGVLGRRGFAVESALEQICREAGARVSTNVMVRKLDIARSSTDARRLEVVAEGLAIFGGV